MAQCADQQRQTHWRTCCRRPAWRGLIAILPPIIEPRSTAKSADTAGRTRLEATGCCTCFSGSAASREQQHWTLGLHGAPFGSHDCFGGVRWQQLALAEVDGVPSCRMTPQHNPGGTASMRLVATATSWAKKDFIGGILRILSHKCLRDIPNSGETHQVVPLSGRKGSWQRRRSG